MLEFLRRIGSQDGAGGLDIFPAGEPIRFRRFIVKAVFGMNVSRAGDSTPIRCPIDDTHAILIIIIGRLLRLLLRFEDLTGDPRQQRRLIFHFDSDAQPPNANRQQ